METLLALWGGVAAAAWLGALALGLRDALTVKRVGDLRAAEPARWPPLSVVIAACNEASHLEATVKSLLLQDYPELEVVVVDDRSEDGTGAVADRLAAADRRVRALHVADLPPGWIGKPHALGVGLRAARGDLVLFTDADVLFEAGILRTAVAWCEERGVDHLALAPFVHAPSVLQESVGAAFASAFLLGTRGASVARTGSRAYVGVGAFNLVRRAVFDRTPGFEWLRMEVLDDVGVGLMMHRAGARKDFALALRELRITWYPSLRAMARGLEKNMYGAIARYRPARLVAILGIGLAAIGGLGIALALPGAGWVRGLALAAVATALATAVVIRARTGSRLGPLLLAPIGAAILAGILVRSAVQCTRRGGIVWRGTFYPVDALRRGQRVKL